MCVTPEIHGVHTYVIKSLSPYNSPALRSRRGLRIQTIFIDPSDVRFGIYFSGIRFSTDLCSKFSFTRGRFIFRRLSFTTGQIRTRPYRVSLRLLKGVTERRNKTRGFEGGEISVQ